SAARARARRRSRRGRGRTTNRARSVGRRSFCLLGAARGPPGVGAGGWSLLLYRHFAVVGRGNSAHVRAMTAGGRRRSGEVRPLAPVLLLFPAREPMRFEGTSAYVATDDLKVAVNAAITLERPLLVKGEPGTGKTVLALEVAKSLGAPLIEWHIKSTTKALQGLYEYDAVSRLR